jgi:hypothetical protein
MAGVDHRDRPAHAAGARPSPHLRVTGPQSGHRPSPAAEDDGPRIDHGDRPHLCRPYFGPIDETLKLVPSPSARDRRHQQTGSCQGGQCGDDRADHEGPYRVVVPGDTPPHSRAGQAGIDGMPFLVLLRYPLRSSLPSPRSPPPPPSSSPWPPSPPAAPPPVAPPQHQHRSVAGNPIIVCTVRQRVQQMYTPKRNKAYSTK